MTTLAEALASPDTDDAIVGGVVTGFAADGTCTVTLPSGGTVRAQRLVSWSPVLGVPVAMIRMTQGSWLVLGDMATTQPASLPGVSSLSVLWDVTPAPTATSNPLAVPAIDAASWVDGAWVNNSVRQGYSPSGKLYSAAWFYNRYVMDTLRGGRCTSVTLKVPPAPGGSGVTNLLTPAQATMESDAHGWTTNRAEIVRSTLAHSGESSLQVQWGGDTGFVVPFIAGTVAGLIAGRTYSVSAWVDVPEDAARVIFVIGSQGFIGPLSEKRPGWQRIQGSFVPTPAVAAGSGQLQVWLETTEPTARDLMRIDDALVVEGDTPPPMLCLRLILDDERRGTGPTWADEPALSLLPPDTAAGNAVPLPLSWGQALIDGTARGVGLQASSMDDYATYAALTDDATSGRLTIGWA